MRFPPLIPALLLAVSAVAPGSAQPAAAVRGNHHDHPVYYERFDEPLLPHQKNVESLHDDRLYLRHYPAVDVSGFNWSGGGIDDFSWWIQVEELRFLLPFIGSSDPADRALAQRWFLSWYESQRLNPFANPARWGEPMSAAYRGMVLVYFLTVEESRGAPNAELVNKLRSTIHYHREFLKEEHNFNDTSNHGLVEALGLIEVTRVFPDPGLEKLGVERMLRVVGKSVSEKGSHKEHSPVYHFVFLDWLDRFAEYLNGLPHLPRAAVETLYRYRVAMVEASWFFTDHDGTIAQLGDSDSVQVEERYPRLDPATNRGRKPVLFDREAGYAIYKGNRIRGDARYAVFAIQNRRPTLINHYHDDVLSVYYAYDGEVLWGDGGKYEYSATADRRFFVSPAAHNTVFPVEYLHTRRYKRALFLADQTVLRVERRGVSFFARVVHSSANVNRTVRIPKHGHAIEVEDRIVWPPGGTERDRASLAGETPLSSVQVWNLGPDVAAVEPVETGDSTRFEWMLTSRRGREFRMRLSFRGAAGAGGPDVAVVRGGRGPVAGWYSPAMFVKRPAWAILAKFRPRRELVATTLIEPVDELPFVLRVPLRGY